MQACRESAAGDAGSSLCLRQAGHIAEGLATPAGQGQQGQPHAAWPDTGGTSWLGSHEDLIKSDAFRINCFKVLSCMRRRPHDWKLCPWAHVGEKARRRSPSAFSYSAELCPDHARMGVCPRGQACDMAHSLFEMWLHPARYRTTMCKEGAHCTRKVCFFAHSADELRTPIQEGSCSGSSGSTGGLGQARLQHAGQEQVLLTLALAEQQKQQHEQEQEQRRQLQQLLDQAQARQQLLAQAQAEHQLLAQAQAEQQLLAQAQAGSAAWLAAASSAADAPLARCIEPLPFSAAGSILDCNGSALSHSSSSSRRLGSSPGSSPSLQACWLPAAACRLNVGSGSSPSASASPVGDQLLAPAAALHALAQPGGCVSRACAYSNASTASLVTLHEHELGLAAAAATAAQPTVAAAVAHPPQASFLGTRVLVHPALAAASAGAASWGAQAAPAWAAGPNADAPAACTMPGTGSAGGVWHMLGAAPGVAGLDGLPGSLHM